MAAYYLATPEGEPLSAVRYPSTDSAYDACEAIYGEGAWNDTVLLCEDQDKPDKCPRCGGEREAPDGNGWCYCPACYTPEKVNP